MNELVSYFLPKFFEHLFFVLLCFVLIFFLHSLFLKILNRISTAGWIFFNDIDKINSGRFDIKFKKLNIYSTHFHFFNETIKLCGVDKKCQIINFRIYDESIRDNQTQINKSIFLEIKASKIPINFVFKLMGYILLYKLYPRTFKTGEIQINFTKSMNRIIQEKIKNIDVLIFNLKLESRVQEIAKRILNENKEK